MVCTNGDKGTSDRTLKPEKLAAIREKEQLDAAEELGIEEVVFLRFPDQNLEDCREFRLALSRQIRKHRPDLVVTIDPSNRYIRHRDHYMTGRVTLDAIFPYARDHLAFPELIEEGLEPFNVKEVWLFRHQEPDVFVDITDTFVTKMDSLYRHVSQMGRPKETAEARSRERAAETGKHIGGGWPKRSSGSTSGANRFGFFDRGQLAGAFEHSERLLFQLAHHARGLRLVPCRPPQGCEAGRL